MFKIYLEKYSSFYNSWLEELAEVLVALGGKKSWQLMALMTDSGYEIYQKKSGRIKLLGKLDKTSSSREVSRVKKSISRAKKGNTDNNHLRLTSSNVLQKTIILPGGASDVLEPVIKNQMRRLVPWAEDDTCFSYTINNEKSTDQQLSVTIIAASKSYLKKSIEELEAFNFHTGSVEFAEGANARSGLEILSLGSGNIEKKKNAIHRSVLSFSCIIAAITILGLWGMIETIQKQHKNSQQLERMKRMVNLLQKRNLNNIKLAKQRSFLIGLRRKNKPVVLILEGLSKTIPDSAWLQKLEINREKITLNGNARNTTELVRVLEASPMLKDVRFSAPTTRIGVSDLESFSIVSENNTSANRDTK